MQCVQFPSPMMTHITQPLISICIPTYNGYPYIETLVIELLRSSRSDFEIVVSDDCSIDETWDFAVRISRFDNRLQCFRNASNLGMDRNFAACVARARGRFVWLTGQDDRLFHEGLDALAAVILKRPELDFLHLNYTRVEESKSDGALIRPVSGDQHEFGVGIESFLACTGGWLPTFLPLFVMKRRLWQSVDVSHYFGTYFCQVGAFVESSRAIRWCHLDGNYVVGLTPVNGWQFKPLSFARIVFGNYVMLDRVDRRCDWLGPAFIRTQYWKIYDQLVYCLIMLSACRLKVDGPLLESMKQAATRVPYVDFTLKLMLRIPAPLGELVLLLIQARRAFRRFKSDMQSRWCTRSGAQGAGSS